MGRVGESDLSSSKQPGKRKAKHPGGRPTKYNAVFHPQIVYALARNGDTEVEIAEHLDVAPSTVALWENVHPEFSESLNKGRADVDAQVENALLRRALGYDYIETTKEPRKAEGRTGLTITKEVNRHLAPDVAAAFIWLKNRKPQQWRDRREITGNDGGPVRFVMSAADEAL